jgi:hypothetical protein
MEVPSVLGWAEYFSKAAFIPQPGILYLKTEERLVNKR